MRSAERFMIRAAVAAAVLTLAVTACGNSGGTSSTAANSNASSADDASYVANAEAAVAPYLKPPAVTSLVKGATPLQHPPAKGKFIIGLACNQPGCLEYLDAGYSAAKALGWKYQTLTTTGTPQDIIAKFQSAVALKPDAIITAGFTQALLAPAVASAKKAGIPVVTSDTPGSVAPNFIANINPIAEFQLQGDILGNWTIATSNGHAKALIVNVPSFAATTAIADSMAQTLGKCPTCSVQTLNLALEDVGTSSAGAVVSALQRNPDINYVAFTDPSWAVGVAPALRAASIDDVKLIGKGVDSTTSAQILNGTYTAFTAFPQGWTMWACFDALAHYFVNGHADALDALANPTEVLTKAALEEPDVKAAWDNGEYTGPYQEEFEKVWDVG
jgi:ribose transport system substrate-binding protein